MYKIRKHKGRSGKSVYEWRVYHVFDNGRRQTQLGKHRTEEAALKELAFRESRDRIVNSTR
jgi:hypothetical protein